jgi:hypothetical protein
MLLFGAPPFRRRGTLLIQAGASRARFHAERFGNGEMNVVLGGRAPVRPKEVSNE